MSGATCLQLLPAANRLKNGGSRCHESLLDCCLHLSAPLLPHSLRSVALSSSNTYAHTHLYVVNQWLDVAPLLQHIHRLAKRAHTREYQLVG